MNKKQAEVVERCVSDLERCRIDGSIPNPATTLWLAGVSAEIHAKIAKHGLTRPFHNLRSSRQTELTERFPSHVVAAWLGNSIQTADKHYLQVLASHFEQATHNPTQQVPALAGNGPQSKEACIALQAIS